MIRIVIAEDQRLLRGALAALLDLEPDLQVIGQAADGEEALGMILRLEPDVCLMDIEMPARSGLEVAERLQAAGSGCKVIILTTFARPGYFERAAQAGVRGYLLKDEPSERMAESIRSVARGRREVSPELILSSAAGAGVNPLTERERSILKLAAEGLTAGEIASQLYLSAGTVRNCISVVLGKLEAKNRIEAIVTAERKGWL